jgi:hypothetical protein
VVFDGSGGYIGPVSILSLISQSPASLCRVSGLTVHGDTTWLKAARMQEVDFSP